MPSKLVGKWKLKDSDKFDEYMKKVGVNVALRKIGNVIPSTTEITEEGPDQVRINIQSTFRSSNMLYVMGQETDETALDGRKCRTTVTRNGEDKLLEIQTWNDGKRQTKIEWIAQLDGEELLVVLECDGVVCRRTHVRC